MQVLANITNINTKRQPDIIELAAYKLPDKNNYPRIFDAVPRLIKKNGFDIFDYQQVFDDEPTKELIREGKTIGCFYIESPGMRSLLKRTDCDTFEMLTAVSSVIRPGVAESGMMKEFIERHKDPSRRKYLLPEMEEYLGETYGVMIYQEDVIKVAYHIVGLTLEESDLLRRAMSGRMRSHKAMQLIIDKFFSCCKTKNYSEEVSQKLWRQIESFAGYAFCKAHSASFALLSFQVAYLKAHYPAKFMASVLSNGGGFYSAAVYIAECRRLNLKVLLPSVNESVYEYNGNDNTLRIGLMAVTGLDSTIIDRIVIERNKSGLYKSLEDFLIRTQAGYQQSERLIKCGAMDCFNETRPSLLRLLDIYFKKKHLVKNGMDDLFAKEVTKLEQEVITDRQFDIDEMCINEYETFDYMVSKHPLEFFRNEVNLPGLTKAADIPKYHNKRVKMIGWYMSSKRIKTKKGEVMKFLSLEDLSGTFEAVIFPKTYHKYAELTISMGPYLIEGKVDAENGNNIIVDTMSVLGAEKARSITQKERTSSNFFGDPEKSAELDEFNLVSSLDKEKLARAYV
jgi:DNA polymerase III alpha subunit